jgi:uncharacterized protein (DUF1684 family)
MKKLLLASLFLLPTLTGLTQTNTTYLDSLQSWRKDYVEMHGVLRTPEQKSFLRFYPLDASYRILSTFEKATDSTWFNVPTAGTISQMCRNYGRLTFTFHDTTLHLVLYQIQSLMGKDDTKNVLFIGFTDLTSAVDTYGAGRYIDCTIEEIHDGKLLLDFNKSYNPYCAYTTGYNCLIPPRENDLPVAVLAGEKNYGKKVH